MWWSMQRWKLQSFYYVVLWRLKMSQLFNMTPNTFSLSDTATLVLASAVNVGNDFLSRCGVPKNMMSDLSEFNCRLVSQNQCCRVDVHLARQSRPVSIEGDINAYSWVSLAFC